MNEVQPENVDGFKRYEIKLANGADASTSSRKGNILSQSDTQSINLKNYINNRTPSYIL